MATTPAPLTPPNSNPGFFSRIGAFLKTAFSPSRTSSQPRLGTTSLWRKNDGSGRMRSNSRNSDCNRNFSNLRCKIRTFNASSRRSSSTTIHHQNSRRKQPSTSSAPIRRQLIKTDEGQTGVVDTDLKGVITPRMVNVPNPAIGLTQQRNAGFNQTFPSGVLPMAPPTMPPAVEDISRNGTQTRNVRR
jgi:hypothetical protein